MYYGGRPQEYRDQLIEQYGVERVDELAAKRHEVRQWSRLELAEMIETYTELVAELENTLANTF